VLAGIVVVAAAHATMVAVMGMTPLHMGHGGASLQLVGLVISIHIVGMYAFSPLVGRATDRFGRRAVVGVGG
jgi:MFS family permease